MGSETWVQSFPAEIIVCDSEGIILDMNDVAIGFYEREGGRAMIGKNVFDHHVEPVRTRVKRLIDRREKIIYTTEKNGNKKLVTIAPWLQETKYAGFVLITIDLPEEISNINKDAL